MSATGGYEVPPAASVTTAPALDPAADRRPLAGLEIRATRSTTTTAVADDSSGSAGPSHSLDDRRRRMSERDGYEPGVPVPEA